MLHAAAGGRRLPTSGIAVDAQTRHRLPHAGIADDPPELQSQDIADTGIQELLGHLIAVRFSLPVQPLVVAAS